MQSQTSEHLATRRASWLAFALLTFVAMLFLAVQRHMAFWLVALLGFAPAFGGYLASRTSQRSTLFGAIRLALIAVFVATVFIEFLTFLKSTPRQWNDYWLESIAGILIAVPVAGSYVCVSAIIMEVLSRLIAWVAWLASKQYLDDGRGQTE